ncbi:MAG: glucose 1-dehydrogenase [Dehalococcoidia bacterium]|jgi:NAD(P)-dependent dehydrogenase (short-subunit alcohol dehydrogenase family)
MSAKSVLPNFEGSAFDLTNRVALVTGSARGIGEAIAKVLAKAGASVVICDLLVEKGREVANEINKSGGKAIFHELDISKEDSWKAVMKATLDKFGRFDILVNDAAIGEEALIENVTLESFDRTYKVNMRGTFLGVQNAILAMKPGGTAGRGGTIVNISSMETIVGGMPGNSPYAATKGAISALTRSSAMECARLKYGIRVNAILPGFIQTDMSSKWLEEQISIGTIKDVNEFMSLAAFLLPLGMGKPEDIAWGVLYLASDASSFVTGIELKIDGGFTAF